MIVIRFGVEGDRKEHNSPAHSIYRQAGWKPFSKRVHNGKNYEKYYEEKVERTSKRHTDPQNPSYRIYGQVIDQKSVTGNPKPIISGHNGNLRTNDIDGAITGTIRYTELDPAKRRHFRVTNQTKDIRGAQVRIENSSLWPSAYALTHIPLFHTCAPLTSLSHPFKTRLTRCAEGSSPTG